MVDQDPTLDELFVAHHDRLLRLAVLLVEDPAQAESLVQAAFATARRRRRRLLDADRALSDLRASVVRASRSAPVRGEHQAEVALSDAQRRLLAGLRQLPHRQREVLVLRHWVGLSEAEIGDVVGIADRSVAPTAGRGLRALEVDAPRAPEQLPSALHARADQVDTSVQTMAQPSRSRAPLAPRRTASGWLVVGTAAGVVCLLMAAVASISMVRGEAEGPAPELSPNPLTWRVGGELVIEYDDLRFPVAGPVSVVAEEPMPVGGGSCHAFDYPTQPNGEPYPSLERDAADGCREGLVIQPRGDFAEATEPYPPAGADVALGGCVVGETSLIVTAGGLTADHTVFDCAAGPFDQWLFREQVIWSLDGGDVVSQTVRQARMEQ